MGSARFIFGVWLLQTDIVLLEGRHIFSGGAAAGRICDIVPPDGLICPEDFTPAVVVVCPVFNPWGWAPL